MYFYATLTLFLPPMISARLNRILRKSVDEIIFEDGFIPPGATHIIDNTTGQQFKVASVEIIEDDPNDPNITRSRITIEPDGLNTGCENVSIQHLYQYAIFE